MMSTLASRTHASAYVIPNYDMSQQITTVTSPAWLRHFTYTYKYKCSCRLIGDVQRVLTWVFLIGVFFSHYIVSRVNHWLVIMYIASRVNLLGWNQQALTAPLVRACANAASINEPDAVAVRQSLVSVVNETSSIVPGTSSDGERSCIEPIREAERFHGGAMGWSKIRTRCCSSPQRRQVMLGSPEGATSFKWSKQLQDINLWHCTNLDIQSSKYWWAIWGLQQIYSRCEWIPAPSSRTKPITSIPSRYPTHIHDRMMKGRLMLL